MRKDVLEFLNKAAEAFNSNDLFATYKDDQYIALRTGLFEDCITVYEIGGKVGLFEQWCNRPNVTNK